MTFELEDMVVIHTKMTQRRRQLHQIVEICAARAGRNIDLRYQILGRGRTEKCVVILGGDIDDTRLTFTSGEQKLDLVTFIIRFFPGSRA